MPDRSWHRVVGLVAWLAVPIFAGAYVVATISGSFRSAAVVTSFARLSPALATLDVVAGVGLVLTGSLSWLLGRRGTGMLALLAGISWFGPDWAGNATAPLIMRVSGLVVAAFTLPLLAHLVLRVSRQDDARWVRLALGLGYGATGVMAIAWAAVYVPELDPRCFAICQGGSITAEGDHRVAREFARGLSLWTIAIGASLALWSLVGLMRSPPRVRRDEAPILVPATAIGIAWSAAAIGSLQPSASVPPTGATLVAVFAAQSVSVLLLSLGLGWLLLGERRTLMALRAIAYRLSPLPGGSSLRDALAQALGDPGMRLLYPLPGSGELVDADGIPAGTLSGDSAPVEHHGRVVAVVIRGSDRPPGTLPADLGAAARLAAENEGLIAAVRHQVLELRASRARIVEAADSERRGIERNLHDGAQQRMLSVLYELTLARDRSLEQADERVSARLEGAVEVTDMAIDALRVIARGIHHSVLTEAGLVAALEALAHESSIPVEVEAPAALRCRPESEATLWRVVEATIWNATHSGATGVRARLSRRGEGVDMDLEVEGPISSLDTLALEDRIGAGGGRLVVLSEAPASVRMRAELPCA